MNNLSDTIAYIISELFGILPFIFIVGGIFSAIRQGRKENRKNQEEETDNRNQSISRTNRTNNRRNNEKPKGLWAQFQEEFEKEMQKNSDASDRVNTFANNRNKQVTEKDQPRNANVQQNRSSRLSVQDKVDPGQEALSQINQNKANKIKLRDATKEAIQTSANILDEVDDGFDNNANDSFTNFFSDNALEVSSTTGKRDVKRLTKLQKAIIAKEILDKPKALKKDH